MVVGALRTIAERNGPLVVPSFYWKLLSAEGVRPELDACVRCGDEGPLVAFDMDHGGVLCRTCRTGASLSEDALELMRMILGGRMNDALTLPAIADGLSGLTILAVGAFGRGWRSTARDRPRARRQRDLGGRLAVG